jgi:hypothetical protein
MTVTFYFYYEFGNFPTDIIQRAYEINQAFEFRSHKLDNLAKWTLLIEYEDLAEDEIRTRSDAFREAFADVYDGWARDVSGSSGDASGDESEHNLKDYYDNSPEMLRKAKD